MKKFLKKHLLSWNVLLLLLGGGLLYATGYHIRIYSGLKNRLILSGIITPGRVDAGDFEAIAIDPETLGSLALVDGDGRRLTLGDFEQELLLINHWASWCPPCVAEMPGLNALYEARKGQTGFVLISRDRSMEAALAYRDRKGYSFPVYMATGEVPAALRAGSIPTTFILDKKGGRLYRYTGMIAFDDPAMTRLLTTLSQ